jgi:tetratricopeptide (TPR) repeat protein
MAQMAWFQGFLRLSTASAVVLALPFASLASDTLAETEPARSVATSAEAPIKALPGEKLVKSGISGSFLSGRFARQNQDLREAAKYLSETLARDPQNEALKQETMRMMLLAGDVVGATTIAHQLVDTAASDPLVASLLMLESVKANDLPHARSVIEQSSSAGLFGLIRPAMLGWIQVAQGANHKAVDLKSAIEKAGFFAPFINYHGALMNDVLGHSAAAQAAYAKANVDPSVTPYRVVEALANFHQRQGDWEKAQAVFDAYALANPQSSLLPERLTATTPKPAPLIANAREGLAELYFTTASILFGEDATQETFLYLRIALDLQPNLPPAQLMLASLYEQVEDYQEAIATYDAIPQGSVFYRRAQVRKSLNYEALNQRDKALLLLDSLASRYPKDPTALITKGDMQRDAKEYAEAAETYGIAIARTEPLSQADWPLLYARGISHERAGAWDLAEADFKRALELEPSQPDVLNYLAYSWLTMNVHLDKAHEYLEIAVQQRPDDAHILDSLGWALFLKGDYPAAVAKFEQAIEMLPDDPTVNDHLGDAYWRVGRQTEARFQWERALLFKPEKEIADQLKEKLAQGLPPREEAPFKNMAAPAPRNGMPSPADTQVQ